MLNRSFKKYINRRFLSSIAYNNIMTLHLIEGEDWFHLADKSENFTYRSSTLAHLGAWRWLSIYQYRNFIMDLIFSDKKGIDFGGGNGPIGGNARVVDKDPTFFLTLDDLQDSSLDYIFSSHTLEHLDNMEEELEKLYGKLKIGGKIVIIVPCYSCVRWRAGQDHCSHKRTFSLEDDEYMRIDKEIEKVGFVLEKAEYCWDDSIFIVGDKI